MTGSGVFVVCDYVSLKWTEENYHLFSKLLLITHRTQFWYFDVTLLLIENCVFRN